MIWLLVNLAVAGGFDLRAHWDLDDGTGTIATEEVSGADGTLSNATWAPGQVGGGVALGGDGAVEIGPLDLGSSPGLTLAAWVRVDGTAGNSNEARFISKATGTADGQHTWMLANYGDGTGLRFRVMTDTTSTLTLATANGTIPLNTWVHVAGTYDGSQMRLYANGVEVGSRSLSGMVPANPSVAAALGNQPSGTGDRGLDGVLDEVYVFGEALSASQLNALAAGSLFCADGDGDGVCDPDDVCMGDDASGDSDGDGICDDSEFVHTQTDIVAGEMMTFTADRARPGADVYLLVSTRLAGSTCHPRATSTCTPLARPIVLGQAVADAQGQASFTVTVPSVPAGLTVYSQAVWVDRTEGDVSPVVEAEVVEPVIVPDDLRVLVFTRTLGFRHGSISDGLSMLGDMAIDESWQLQTTEDPAVLTAALPDTDVVVFLNTTGNVLDTTQEDAFEAWLRAGGGWVGVHAAADTEYGWPFYGQLVGAWFNNHPAIQDATLIVEDPMHPATETLTSPWMRRDEWYNFRINPRPSVQVLLTIDESTYSGGNMGADHPISWCQDIDSGRAFYTGLGHTGGTYAEQGFVDHVRGAVLWVARRE